MIYGIPSAEARGYWGIVEPWLSVVVDRFDPGFTTDDIISGIEEQRYQLWLLAPKSEPVAAIVTEINNYPQYSVLHAPYIGGSRMNEWFDNAFDVLEAFAKYHGCKYLTGCGRRGWIKQGASRGYQEVYTVVRKQI